MGGLLFSAEVRVSSDLALDSICHVVLSCPAIHPFWPLSAVSAGNVEDIASTAYRKLLITFLAPNATSPAGTRTVQQMSHDGFTADLRWKICPKALSVRAVVAKQ